MISGKQLHGLRVFDAEGAALGRIQDIIADGRSGAVRGYIVSADGIISGVYFILAAEVATLDINGLRLKSGISVRKRRIVKRGPNELHLGELTSAKGCVTDILIDQGRIAAVELSQGLLSDIRLGRQIFLWEEL